MLRFPRRLAHSTGKSRRASCGCCGGELRLRNALAKKLRTRRSRTSCPARPRSARESDLRASSPAFAGHYGVELRFRCFSRTAARLSSLDTSLHHTGEFLVTRSRRCHRLDRIIHATPAIVQEAKTPKCRLSTRNLRCPRRSAAIHAIHSALRRGSRAACARRPPWNATKPRKFPYVASISTRIDLRVSSPTFIGQDGVELRIGVSFKCRSAFASRHRFCAGELLVARPSSLPST
jgi:hypothetical protein